MTKSERVSLDGVVWLRRDALADGYSDKAIAKLVRDQATGTASAHGAYTSGRALGRRSRPRTATASCAAPCC